MRLKNMAEKCRHDVFFKDGYNKQIYEKYTKLYTECDFTSYIASILFDVPISNLTKQQIYTTKRCILKNIVLHFDDVL